MDLWKLLADIVMLLAACLLAGGVLSRFGQSPIIGYLLAGMVLGGPGGIHAVQSEAEIEAIAELGVALLLFSLGLEFSFARVRRLGVRSLVGGAGQVLLSILLAAACAMPFGVTSREAIAFGVMLSLSSTAVVLRLLAERSELDMPHGRNSLAVLLTQDMAVVPLALVMTILGEGGGASAVALQLGRLVLMAGGLVLGLVLVNAIAVRALGLLTLHRNRELTVILAVVIGLGSAWAAHAVGISPALGAFVAGMLLGSSPFATQIRADVSSLRVVLLTLFFGAAGMVADPVWIVANWYVVAGVTLVVVAGKLALVWALFRLLGQSNRVSAATGLCLAQIGEFAFVLGSIGRANGVVSAELYALVVSVAIVSFVLTALLVPAAIRFGNLAAALLGEQSDDDDGASQSVDAPDVVVIGFGPAGRIAIGPFLEHVGKVVVVDLNREGVEAARELGFRGEIGDATQHEVLEHARIAHCRAVVITIPHHRSALSILQQVRQLAPQAHVVVRSRYQRHTEEFVRGGAHVVVGDEEEVGRVLADALRRWFDTTSPPTDCPSPGDPV